MQLRWMEQIRITHVEIRLHPQIRRRSRRDVRSELQAHSGVLDRQQTVKLAHDSSRGAHAFEDGVRDEDFVQAVEEREEFGLGDLVGGEGGRIGAGEGAGEGGAEWFVGFLGMLGEVWWRVGFGVQGSYAVSRMGERGRAMVVSMDLGWAVASPGLGTDLVQASSVLHHKAAIGRCCQTVAYERVHCWARGMVSRFCTNPS